MRVSVQQAAVNALARYLRTELPGVVVSDEWPSSEADLPEKAVTILMAGKRGDEHADALLVETTGTGDTRTFTWRVKFATQPLQLDVWAQYSPARDEILAQLDDALNKGELYTLGTGVVSLGSGDPTRDGVLLALDPTDGHEGFVDFTFDGPSLGDNAERSLRSEYRATLTGDASMVVTVKTTHPVLKVAGLRLRVGETPEAMPVENVDIPLDQE